MKTVIREYGNQFQQYAPYGYARLVAQTRDFHLAQTILEDALVRGFGGYKHGYFAASSPRVALQSLRRVIKEQIEAVPIVDMATEEESSMSRATRIRNIEDHLEALFTFKDEDLMALVLRFVEEVPPARITEWTGVSLHRQEDLKKELKRRSGDLEACERTLTQYRIPGRFLPDLLNRIHEQWKGNITLRRTTWMFLGALSIGACMVVDAQAGTEAPMLLGSLRKFALAGLAFVVVVGILFLTTGRIFKELLTGSIFGRPEPTIGTGRLVMVAMGIPLLLAQVLLLDPSFVPRIKPYQTNLLNFGDFLMVAAILTIQVTTFCTLLTGLIPRLGGVLGKIPGTERTVPGS